MSKQNHRRPRAEKTIVAPAGRFPSVFLDGLKPYIWLLLAVALVYGQTIRFGFVGYDDISLVSRQAGQAIDLGRIKAAFSESAFGPGPGLFFYRPLLTLSLMFDSAIAGGRPWVFHLSNVILHLAAVWLAFVLFLKLKLDRPKAFTAALLLAVHPALASAAAWVPGRNDSLLAIWIISSFLFQLKFLESDKIRYLAVQGICFVFALFTKETALVFPLVAASHLLLQSGQAGRSLKKILSLASVLFGAMVIWHLARSNAMAGYNPGAMSFLSLKDALLTLVSVFGRIGLPFDLTLVRDLKDVNLAYGLTSLAALIAAAVIGGLRNKRAFAFGAAWFGLFLMPSLALAGDSNAFLDHRLYLPLTGFLVAVLELKALDIRDWGKKTRTAGILFLASLGAVSFSYSRTFKDDLSCWVQAVKRSPSSALAHNSLGLAYSQRKYSPAAEQEYLKARQISKGYVKAGLNLGILYLRNGRPEKAGQVLKEVLSVRPDLVGANHNLGVVYQQKGQEDSALIYYQKELEYDPRNDGALAGAGTIYHQKGDLEQATLFYRKALAINGNNTDVLINQATLFQQRGDFAEAERSYLKALGIKPGIAEAHFNLGRLYQKQNRRQEAEIELNKAYSLKPSLKSQK